VDIFVISVRVRSWSS